MKLGFLYAGQGSQHAGMGRDLYEAHPAFRQAVDSAALPFDLHSVCFDDPDGLLDQTRFTQPCMVAFAAGVTAVLRERGIEPDVAAGLSLGEYSALHAAGVFDARTAVELAAFRGEAMQRAAQGVESAVIDVMGLNRGALSHACEEASGEGVAVIANYNCPGQLVIGGEKAAVERAALLAREAGARRCMPLHVSGPFHTPLMASAGEALRARLEQIPFGGMRVPVIFTCLGDMKPEGVSIQELLVRQVQSSVYMEDSIRRMVQMGVDAMVGIGPGRALSGFVRRMAPQMPVFAVETVADVEALAPWICAVREGGTP